MANNLHLEVLRQGLQTWNRWRQINAVDRADLSNADLRGVDLSLMPALREADSRGLIPPGASWAFIANEIVGHDVEPLDLTNTDLRGAILDGADLRCADCRGSDLSEAKVSGAELGRAKLARSRLVGTDLSRTALRGADLSESVLIRTDLTESDLAYANVYGVSVWDVVGKPRDATNLIVSPPGTATLSTDSLPLAQLLYMLIRNENIREMVDTLTTKVILILGNFGKERKDILDSVRDKLRSMELLPVLFDFNGPASKDTTGTVETLARLSRLIMADLSDPSSIPHELATIVPFLRTTPVLMLRQTGSTGYSMANDLQAYPWVLAIHEYASKASLLEGIHDVIHPALMMSDKLQGRTR